MKICIISLFIVILYFSYSCNQSSPKNNNVVAASIFYENNNIVQEQKNTASIPKEYLLGKINPETDSLFTTVPDKYCMIRKEYIHKDVLEPFIAMYEAAARNNINLKIISAHRTFNVQKWLWNQKYYNSDNQIEVTKKVLNYTAMPGTSRHHWGTDIDILSTKLSYYETEEGKKAYKWMQENAPKFGFYQVYTIENRTGYNEEKWHWSYLEVANEFSKQYKAKITYDDIIDFNGCELAKNLNVIEDYVLNINSIEL